MRFRGLFLSVVALTALASWAAAADKQSASQPQGMVVNPDSSAGNDALNSDFFFRPGSPGTSDRFGRARNDASRTLGDLRMPTNGQALVDGHVCYTMRTYVVKPSERLLENESGFRGYSSCQLASTYRFRSADLPAETGAKPK